MVHIKCPKCGDYLSVPDASAGKTETCPNCGNITIVPDVSSHQEPKGNEQRHIFLFGGAERTSDPAIPIMAALGMIVGGFIGALTVDPEDPFFGAMMGGFFGFVFGILIGGAIAASNSKK